MFQAGIGICQKSDRCIFEARRGAYRSLGIGEGNCVVCVCQRGWVHAILCWLKGNLYVLRKNVYSSCTCNYVTPVQTKRDDDCQTARNVIKVMSAQRRRKLTFKKAAELVEYIITRQIPERVRVLCKTRQRGEMYRLKKTLKEYM